MCERELETEQNCNILTPTLLAIIVFLSRSPGLLNRGPGGPASVGHGSHSSIFSPTHSNFLSPGLYNNLTSTCFLRASQNSTARQSSSPLISRYLRQDAPVIYTGAFLILTAWPGRRSICNTKPRHCVQKVGKISVVWYKSRYSVQLASAVVCLAIISVWFDINMFLLSI